MSRQTKECEHPECGIACLYGPELPAQGSFAAPAGSASPAKADDANGQWVAGGEDDYEEESSCHYCGGGLTLTNETEAANRRWLHRLVMPLRITLEVIPRGDESRKRVMGTLDIENTGDHPQRPKLANYHYRMTGPVHGGDTDHWHEGTLRDVERARGYWAHVKEVLNAVDCESQPMDEA